MNTQSESRLAGGARRLLATGPGGTGIVVSRIGYGAMELAGAPRARALEESFVATLLNQILDAGINFIDTSIDYGMSETLIGKSLAHRRSEFILASKCACEVGIEHPARGEKHIYSGVNVIAGVEQSLRRLKTEYLDVVQVHGDPSRKQLEEGGVIDALLELQRAGKVRFFGISSRLPLLAEFVGVECFSVIQVPYSALQRTNENVISDLRRAGKSIVARGVTGRGAPAKNWATRPIGTADGEVRELWQRAGLDDLLDGMSRIEFMIRFAMANDDIDIAMVATTDLAHLAADIEIANKGPLDPLIFKQACDRLSAAGGGAGQGKYTGGGGTVVL